MNVTSNHSFLRQLGFVVASWKEDRRTDVELLRRFIQTRDEQAFTTLVGRHSELVWGVCLRVLRNPADAEDALQATFLRLARDAERIINREALAAWLYRVSRDCSIDLRRSILRQRRLEGRLAEMADRDVSPSTDLRVLLDDELDQLPSSHRAALILVCLEGRTYADAALELGCSIATVHRRITHAQTRLRRKLARKGVATAIITAGSLSLPTADAKAAPPALLARTVESGLALARTTVMPVSRAGQLAANMVAPTFNCIRVLVATILMFTALSIVALGAIRPRPSSERADGNNLLTASNTSPQQKPKEPFDHPPHTNVTGVILGADGQPLPGAAVTALARQPFLPGERGLRDTVLTMATTDENGQFTLHAPDQFATWFVDRTITIQASAPGLAPVTLPLRIPHAKRLELQLGTAPALRGRFVDSEHRPVARARVEVIRMGDAVSEPVLGGVSHTPPGWPAPVQTSADGTFALPYLGNSENVWVRVVDPRFALDTFRVDNSLRNAGLQTFGLEPAQPVVIEVLAADTGLPLAGTRITVITDQQSAHPYFCTSDHAIRGLRFIPSDIDAVTNAQGRAHISLTPGDRAEILVHASACVEPYIGIRTEVEIPKLASRKWPDQKDHLLTVRLTRGVWVSGAVTDESGKPLAGSAVHWGRESATQPEWRDRVLTGRDAITRTSADGVFKLAVLPGACTIRAYGPTADFTPAVTSLPGTTNTTLFAHHIVRMNVPETGDVPPLQIALKTACSVSGKLETAPTYNNTLLLASGRVSPVRGYATLPLPVRDGSFIIPGCREGYTTHAYFLDPISRTGAVTDVTPGSAIALVKLLPCGAIRFRVCNADGTPKANESIYLSLLADRDRRPNVAAEAVSDPQPVEWFDVTNYPFRPKTNADGVAELPALIPGARYSVSVGSSRVRLGQFTIASGKTITLPDVILPNTTSGINKRGTQ